MQEKRNSGIVDYRPRLGRRSNEDAEPKPYDVLFTPRMGKRSEIFTNYTPRLGRSVNSGEAKIIFFFQRIYMYSVWYLCINHVFFLQSKEWTPNNVNHLLMMTLRANGIRIKAEIMEKLQMLGYSI